MMDQVREISETVQPHYTFLVIDAMTGQDAVTTAEAFHKTLQLDGVILTKIDGDARGGAALSVKEVVGRPIAFASTGEKLEDFELFHPDRMAGRILGMGDVLTLIDQAEQAIKREDAEKAVAKMAEGRFTLDDFLDQLQAGKEDGAAFGLDRDAPDGPEGSPQYAGRRLDAETGRGDHPLDDAGRKSGARHHQRLAPLADCSGFGDFSAGRQRAPGAFQTGAGLHAPGARVGRHDAAELRRKRRPASAKNAGDLLGPGARLLASGRISPTLARSDIDQLTACAAMPRRSPKTREQSNHMAVKLRLMRMGKTKQPTYRVVAADSRSPRDGRFIEIVGSYAPRQEDHKVVLKAERVSRVAQEGAQPTDRVRRILVSAGPDGCASRPRKRHAHRGRPKRPAKSRSERPVQPGSRWTSPGGPRVPRPPDRRRA